MLPDYICATQTMIFNTDSAREYLSDLNAEMPSDAEILELIESWADDEFGWGEYILTDPEGIEL